MQSEIDLGQGRRLIRKGMSVQLTGFGQKNTIVLSSLDGGISHAKIDQIKWPLLGENPALLFLVGLGSLGKESLKQILALCVQQAAIVVLIPGAADSLDEMQQAIKESSPRVLDGTQVRVVGLHTLEWVTLPGSEEPSQLSSETFGCLLRDEDVRALASSLKKPVSSVQRFMILYGMKKNVGTEKVSTMLDSSIAFVGGPLDFIEPLPLEFSYDSSINLNTKNQDLQNYFLMIPRVFSSRTTSEPSVLTQGAIRIHAQESKFNIEAIHFDKK